MTSIPVLPYISCPYRADTEDTKSTLLADRLSKIRSRSGGFAITYQLFPRPDKPKMDIRR
jgi:hypothetical protein